MAVVRTLADSGQYWAVIAIGSEASVLTTAGDLVYYSGSAPTRLPIGLEGQVLQVSKEEFQTGNFYNQLKMFIMLQNTVLIDHFQNPAEVLTDHLSQYAMLVNKLKKAQKILMHNICLK